jgi:hypothetical protein
VRQALSQQPTAREEWGPQSYNHKELNSANNLNELGSMFFLRVSRKEYRAVNILFQP